MKKINKIGFIIVNYNDYSNTSKLLDNIKNYSTIDLIVVVDNNSNDNSYKLLKKHENNKIKIIKNNSRHFSSGLNFGAKFLINEIGNCAIIFSNSDIIIKKEEDLIKLSNYINDDNVVVGPVVNEHGKLNRGWHMPTVNSEIIFNLAYLGKKHKAKVLNYEEKDYKNKTTQVDVVSGCFFLVQSKFLEKVNYFDENTFLYYEEQILATKVKNENKKEIIVNDVTIFHNHSISIDKSLKRINKHKILKKSQRYFCKNYLHANIFQMFLLYLTDYLFRIILLIRGIFRI